MDQANIEAGRTVVAFSRALLRGDEAGARALVQTIDVSDGLVLERLMTMHHAMFKIALSNSFLTEEQFFQHFNAALDDNEDR